MQICIDQIDNRIRIVGPQVGIRVALDHCAILKKEQHLGFVRVRRRHNFIAIRFWSGTPPEVIDDTYLALQNDLCPGINEGLLEAFEESYRTQQEAAA